MKAMRYLGLFSILLLWALQSCQQPSEAQKIVDRAISVHGGKKFESSMISFDFRNMHYEILKFPDRFEYIREFTDSTGQVRDVLNNSGFVRTVNGQSVELLEERVSAFSNSVNSVAYFAFLPYGLNDPAAVKTLVGSTELEGKTYDIIKVAFQEEGGGEDHEDEFLYWFDKETGFLDYMAYSYHTNGGGVRFRKAIKRHSVGGLVLLDYENYKPAEKDTPLDELEALFKAGKLELLSEIIMENIEVK